MKKILACLAVLTISSAVLAETKPFQASLTPDIAICDRDDMVEGLALSVWGENEQKALALGIVNGSTGKSSGLTWSWVLNYADDYTGVQWAAVNYSKGDVLGWQSAWVNYAGGSITGLQSGLVNYAKKLTGLQFGVLNYAETAETGVQIGIINLLPENTKFFGELPERVAPGMIFLNWRF